MKIEKFDIGAEIISILTKGMYPDPRDAIREYIQNAIDAGAKNVDIKVRQNSVVIEDDGIGMDYKTLRNAIRVGVSDKKPGKDIGFMGIGIYSSFHLCDTLVIYTKKQDILPQSLFIDFKGMRELLEQQKINRLNDKINSDQLVDLQSLLESFVKLANEGELPLAEYPIEDSGTRVELVGLNPILDDLLNNYDELSNYLQDVVPLKFNKEKFKWAELIEERLIEIAEKHKEKVDLINLKLQVGTRSEDLFRPYLDAAFSDNSPLEPDFVEIRSGNVFFGIAWGCHNSTNDRINDSLIKIGKDYRGLRGFQLKKQGFSINDRTFLSKYFGASNTYYHRYTGEIVIVNKSILPNASRNDFETSELKKVLFLQIQNKVAPYYTKLASNRQDKNRALLELHNWTNEFKKTLSEYNPYDDNYNNYIQQIGILNEVITKIEKKLKKLPDERKKEAELIIGQAKKLKVEITDKFDILKKKGSDKQKINPTESTKTEIAKNISTISKTISKSPKSFDSLLDLINELGIDLNPSQKKLMDLIDEKYIKGIAKTKAEYYQFINDLKEDFEND